MPAATGVRGPEGFGSRKFLPGRGYLLWNERHDRRDIVPPSSAINLRVGVT